MLNLTCISFFILLEMNVNASRMNFCFLLISQASFYCLSVHWFGVGMVFDLNMISEFERDHKVTVDGTVHVKTDRLEFDAEGVCMSGYGIRIKGAECAQLDLKDKITCTYIPSATGVATMPVNYSVFKIEHISVTETIVSAVFSTDD